MAGDDPSRLFAKLTDDDRKALQEKVVAQIELLLDKGDESSRDHLNRAAADAVRWLDEQSKTQN